MRADKLSRTLALAVDRVPSWMPRALLAALAVVLLGVVLHGFRADRLLLRHSGWTHVGRYRLIHYTKIYWAASLTILLTVPSAFAPIVALPMATAVATTTRRATIGANAD